MFIIAKSVHLCKEKVTDNQLLILLPNNRLSGIIVTLRTVFTLSVGLKKKHFPYRINSRLRLHISNESCNYSYS